MAEILIHDVTLRDGSHAVAHQLSLQQIAEYSRAAELAGIPVIEVGHGNGLGASSMLVGESLVSDFDMLSAAKENLKNTKLGAFIIPGFGTIQKDLKPAFDAGVDVVRVASHCTEANITERHIKFSRENGKEVYGVLMMSHMASDEELVSQGLKIEAYGAEGVILMDSAGASLPNDVVSRISALVSNLKISVGFHAHNNLGMGIANAVAAASAGATILDGSARSFGAGAGNAQLEVLVAVLEKLGYSTGIDLYKVLDLAELAEKKLLKVIPSIKGTSIVSGMAGVFSGFIKQVNIAAMEYDVDPRDIFFELGKRKVVAGQEDLIVEVAVILQAKNRKV
jgi:4-hydroxy 2-oxovalerate aldolase